MIPWAFAFHGSKSIKQLHHDTSGTPSRSFGVQNHCNRLSRGVIRAGMLWPGRTQGIEIHPAAKGVLVVEDRCTADGASCIRIYKACTDAGPHPMFAE